MRRVGLGVMALVLAWTAGAEARKARYEVTCTQRSDGAVAIGTISVRSRGARPFVLDQTSTYDADSGRWQVQATVMQRQQLVLALEQAVARDGMAAGVTRYGRGFKGISEVSFTKQGSTGEMLVDGRPTAPIALGALARSVRFADGSPLPRLRARAATRKALLKLTREARTGCAAGTPAAAIAQVTPSGPIPGGNAERPEGSFACKKCELTCAAAWMACLVATFSNPYAAAVATGLSLIGQGKPTCFEASTQCLDNCHNKVGEACCPVKCGGTCFVADTPCCGNRGCAVGERCANPDLGACCSSDTGDFCGSGCCPRGSRCAFTGACCPEGSGEYCGVLGCCPAGQRCFVAFDEESGSLLGRVCCDREPCGYSTCCPAGSVCVGQDQCARADEICNGSYCPAPGVCLPNGTCCPGGQVCGDQCCNAFGSSCCNGQCCDGACIGGACCPATRACGPSCCPEGYACTDSAAGSCVPCDAGEEACPFSPGSLVTCCPTGQECCAEGCCAPGLQCCRPPGASQVGCFESFQCVR